MELGFDQAPLGLDPLIAEAKRRMRRRRGAVVLVGLLLAVTAVTFSLWPSGGPSPTGSRSGRGGAQAGRSLARLSVPVDTTERQWRSSVRSLAGSAAPRSAVLARRREVLLLARATGATVVRLRIWPRTSPLAVELVVATSIRPAIYLRHRAIRLVNALVRPDYLEVVDRRGAQILELGGEANEGFVGVPRRLQMCSPVMAWGFTKLPPCPVS